MPTSQQLMTDAGGLVTRAKQALRQAMEAEVVAASQQHFQQQQQQQNQEQQQADMGRASTETLPCS
jgi:hypothetical protein